MQTGCGADPFLMNILLDAAFGTLCRLELGGSIQNLCIPGSAHEALFAAGERANCPLKISSVRIGRFKIEKVSQYFFLTAGYQADPSLFSSLIPIDRRLKPSGHGMRRAATIFRVELQFNCDGISHFRSGRLSDVAMQIKIKAPVTNGHHIDVPRFFRLAVDADPHREGLAPTFSKTLRTRRAD